MTDRLGIVVANQAGPPNRMGLTLEAVGLYGTLGLIQTTKPVSVDCQVC